MLKELRKAPWWVWVILIGFACFVIIGIASIATTPSEKTERELVPVDVQKTAWAGTNVAPTTVLVEATASWSNGVLLSETSVRNVLDEADQMTRSLDLSKSASILIDGGIVIVTYKAEEAMSETDLLTIGAQTGFSVHRALFANPLVQTVTVTTLADWTDQYGKTAEEVTTVSTLDRATVDSRIDWKGLEDRVMLDNKNLFCLSDAYRIHPAIYAQLKDKGCLTSAIAFGE